MEQHLGRSWLIREYQMDPHASVKTGLVGNQIPSIPMGIAVGTLIKTLLKLLTRAAFLCQLNQLPIVHLIR